MASRTETAEVKPQLVCASCGTTPAPEDEAMARLSWSKSVEGSRTQWTCDRCSRDNIRSIESKLDGDWW